MDSVWMATYRAMMEWFAGDPGRAQHLIKVHSLAAFIGQSEGLDPETQKTLELAALVHDIGIRPAEQQYGHNDGKLQEALGPAPARELLLAAGATPAQAERCAYLVAHHHTYTDIDGVDLQILIEADFLVNIYEHGQDSAAAQQACTKIFRTAAGTCLCKQMYGL